MKALLLENIHPEAVRVLTEAGYEVETRAGALGEDDLIDALEGIDLLGIRSATHVTDKVLEARSESLKAVGAFCIGTNQIDLGSAAGHGVVAFNAPFSNTRSVVELTIAEIIVLARHLTDKNRLMHEGVWDKSAKGSHEVRGRTLGIVGYGNIGSQLSVVAEALGMRVMFYDIADKLALGNARRANSLEELLAECETVTLHVDGRPGNAGFFGEREFAMMRPRSLFLNLCRGMVVDHSALVANLKSGHIAGAAIDVFPEEPKRAGDPFVSELQGLPNVILTPHVGGSTQEAQEDIGRFVAGKMVDYVETGSTLMSVNLPAVGAPAAGAIRVVHLHRNIPGVMAGLNQVFSNHGANVESQTLGTRGNLGYAVTDIKLSMDSIETNFEHELAEVPGTVRVRVIQA
ncbi:phosphoglycerate dehydrogenase [Propionibacteriaceae bacterium G1746]|uniref:phosphoglycerate dehydrogenase n=1 Tax=Aestuariimicrobium sp. G57 TaxID=3418485 RepID=UPI003C29F4FF